IAASLQHDSTQAIQAEQDGTGHAVGCGLAAIEGFEGTVIVTNADVPLLRAETIDKLRAAHVDNGNAVTVLSIKLSDPTGYGRIVRNEAGEDTAIVEHKDADDAQRAIDEVNSGVSAFDSQVLRDALGKLDSNNTQGELYITDVVEIARTAGHRVGAHVADESSELQGVNDRVQLAAAGAELNARMLDRAMRNGATIVDPASTCIGVDVDRNSTRLNSSHVSLLLVSPTGRFSALSLMLLQLPAPQVTASAHTWLMSPVSCRE